MVASLVFKGKYNVGVNGNSKVKVGGHLLSISDIPFVRYRFDNYGEEELEFIRKNKVKFSGPIHMAEVRLGPNAKEQMDAMDDIDNLVKFLYIPVDDTDIANGLKQETIDLLKALGDTYYDRIMLKDESSMMYALAASRLKIAVEEAINFEFKAVDMGICGSALSFRSGDDEGEACLTAVWARRIMAEYAENDDIVIPTATHECMGCCGCIQYIVVDSDTAAPTSSKEKAANKKESSGNSDGTPKESKPKGVAYWDDEL